MKNYPNLQRGNTVNVGRHKGVREMVLAVTNDGKMIVEEFRKIAYDESNKMADRLEALSWLSDRGFGKAVNQVEISGRDGGAIQVEQASADDLRKELLGIGAIDVAGRIVAAKN